MSYREEPANPIRLIAAPPARVREIVFDPRRDPTWMAGVRQVEPLSAEQCRVAERRQRPR